MPISLQLIEAFDLESLRSRNKKGYDNCHSLADSVIVTTSANKYVKRIISTGFISCNRI